MLDLFKKPAIGLDISDRSIEAVLVLKKGGKAILSSYGRMVIPPGLVVNGHIEKRGELAVMIRKLLADGMTPPLPKGTRRVVFSLPESRVFSHVFQVPRIADTDELGRTLAFEADAFFPYGHKDLIAGHTVINSKPDMKEIYYAAVHRDMLVSYLGLFNEANLEPVAIEGEATSIARALLLATESEPVVLVDIGARVSDLSIFDRDGTQFSETLQVAGDVLTEAIALKMNVSFKEAEELKVNEGLTGTKNAIVQEALLHAIDKLVEDIHDAVEFYEKRSSRKVSRVVLCGGSSLLKGLPEYIGEKLVFPERTMRVELGDPWLTLQVASGAAKARDRGVLLATALGLGLRGAKVKKFAEINFLDKGKDLIELEKKKEKQKPGAPVKLKSPGLAKYPPWLIAGVGTLFFLGTTVGTWFLAYRFYVQPNDERERAEQQELVDVPVETEVVVQAVVGDSFDRSGKKIRGTEITVERTVSGSYEHEATAVDGIAEGTFELVNETGNAQVLVATTRLLSEDGVLFRLKDRVSVPAGGRITATAAADQPGASGNVGPGRFTIPGLSTAQQSVIYAELKEEAVGGLVYEGTPLSEEVFEANKSALLEGSEEALFEKAVEEGADFIILKDLMKVLDPVKTKGPSPGEPTGPYELEMKMAAEVVGLTGSEVAELLADAYLEITGEELAGDTIDLSAVQMEVGKRDAETGETPITFRLII